MAEAFKKAIAAGRSAYLSGLGRTIERGASASSPLTGFLGGLGGVCNGKFTYQRKYFK